MENEDEADAHAIHQPCNNLIGYIQK